MHAGERGFLGTNVSSVNLIDRRLMLDDRLFEQGAMILARLASRRVRFADKHSRRSIEVAFPDTQRLAFWSHSAHDSSTSSRG